MAAERPVQPIIGEAPVFLEMLEHVSRAAPLSKPVLVVGERGTGKELIASRLHFLSDRWESPLIKVNCAAIPDTLIESELFGYDKGAFTGAVSQRKGRFEQANGGTIFLDEIGEITPAFQAKLLRVLQEGTFERVGGTQSLQVDVRVIAATNRDLEAGIKDVQFEGTMPPLPTPGQGGVIEAN